MAHPPSIAIAVGLLCGMDASSVVHASRAVLTPESVRSVVEAIEAALRKDEFEVQAKYLAQDCAIHVAPDPRSRRGATGDTVNRQQYMEIERKAARRAQARGVVHRYQSTTPLITIKGGQAFASLRSIDTAALGGRMSRSVFDRVETIEIRDERIVVTHIEIKPVSLAFDGKRVF